VAPIAAIAQAILPKRNPPMPDRRPKAEVVVATDEDQVIAAEEAQIAAQPPVEEVVETSSEPVMQAYAEPMRRPKAAIDGLKAAAGQPSGWAIQVASSPSEKEARGFLATAARKVPGAVSQASPFTVPFEKNGTTFYRARFGGYATKTAAWNACGALKKKHISCYAIEQ
jgi:D-alanyl-D-alanine carboxypeptidase